MYRECSPILGKIIPSGRVCKCVTRSGAASTGWSVLLGLLFAPVVHLPYQSRETACHDTWDFLELFGLTLHYLNLWLRQRADEVRMDIFSTLGR